MADIGQLRLVVNAETKGMEQAMMRAQNSLRATETAMQALGKGESGNATKAAALERAMTSLARKGLDGNHESMKRLVGAHNQIQKELDETAAATKRAEQRQKDYNAATRASQAMAAALVAGTVAVAGATVKAIGVYGQYEQAQIAFETMLGSAEKGQAFLEDMWEFAKKTPFEYEGVQTAAKQMLAYGFAAESITPTLMAVGDAAAGLGGGTETIERITRALGQMKAKQKVSAEEMRQLAEAGVPAYELLAEAIGTTVPQAMKLAEQGAIPVSRAMDGLVSGMSKKFGGLMDKQSRSVVGLISTTKDLAFGQRGLFGRYGEYAADALNLQERISGLNSGLEHVLSIVEEKGFEGLWDDLIPDGAEPAIAAIGGALTAIAGKGIFDAMVKLAPAIARVAIALGPVGVYGAAAGLALWGAKEAIDAIGADHPEIFGGVPQQKTSSTPESRDVTFGLAAPTDSVQAAAYANEQKAKNDALAKSNKALAAQGQNVYNAALPFLTGSGNTEPVGYGASNAPIDQFRRIEAGETATAAASSNYSLSPQMVDALVQNNRDLIQTSESLIERMAAAYKAAGIEGFASGGFTSGNDKTVAGVVHGGEYVMPAWMVDKYPELAATAEGIRTRGYAEGGPVGDIGGASKAMQRLTGIMRSASKEGERGGDIFATDKATAAVGLYRLAGSSITESLSKARSSGSDAMYNLGSAVANNSRLAKDSAVVNFGNIAAAAEDLASKEPTVIKIIKLSDEELEAAKVSWPKTIDEIAAATIPNLQAWAEAMKITGASAGDGMATGQQKIQESADSIKVTLGSIAIDAEGKMALFNLALTGAMASAVAGMGQQGTMLNSMVGQVMDDMAFKATYAAAIWVVKNQDMENALAIFKDKLAGMQEPVNNLPIVLKQAAEGGLEALNLLASQGDAAIWQVKGAVIDLMASVAKGTPAWAEFGNALIDVAENAIINAEAQMMASKAVAISEAIIKAFATGGASLLAIPAILGQAAVGLAMLEGARALIPDKTDVPKAAAGGIVPAIAGGTNVIVGEGGHPEAIIPLDKYMLDSSAAIEALKGITPADQVGQFASMPSIGEYGGGRGGAGGGITLQVVINNPVVRDDRDIDALAEQVMEVTVRRLKREGVVISG